MRFAASLPAALALALLSGGASWGGETLIGRAAVIDGDTLRLRGTVIGLAGVAAPGLAQTCQDKSGRSLPCGRQAARALSAHIGEAVIACETRGPDPSHRMLGICRLGSEDLNAWMVASGLAVSERFSDTTYFTHETRAWARRSGLWAGVFEDPTGRQRGDYTAAARPPVTADASGAHGPADDAPAFKLSRLSK